MTENKQFFNQLKRYYTWYTGGFVAFVVFLAIAEQMGLSRAWIGYIFLFATITLYAGIGVMSRTVDVAEPPVPFPAGTHDAFRLRRSKE